MTADDSCLRDRTHRLFQACLPHLWEGDSDEATPSLRHLGIASLNLAEEVDPDALIAAGRILPWLAVYLRWEDDSTSIDQLADLIDSNHLVRHLSPEALRRRLARGVKMKTPTIRRMPDGAQAAPADLRRQILADLLTYDEAIEALLELPNGARRDALIENSELLARTLEICSDDGNNRACRELSSLLPPWTISRPSQALEVLARFENTDFSDVPGEWSLLPERSRRFEQSLAEHLRSHGLVCAIRAAVAFGPADNSDPLSARVVRRFLSDYSPFASDPALQELTLALIQCRHLAIAHLSGAAPLGALQPWVNYLRGSCSELAESRGITLREATNFAHYSFHLVNLLDLSAREDVDLHDPLRRALMDLEEELKEFALVGQREGLTDRQSDLSRFEQTRWRNESPRRLLAVRIVRLGGAWRRGYESELVDDVIARLQQGPELDAAAHLMRNARLQSYDWLATWSPEQIAPLLVLCLCAARNSDEIDINAPFTIDLAPLKSWFNTDGTRRRAAIITTLLAQRSISSLIASPSLPPTGGLIAETVDQRLQLHFRPTPELEALLTLLASCKEDDPLATTLHERLARLCELPSNLAASTDRQPPITLYNSDKNTTENELSG